MIWAIVSSPRKSVFWGFKSPVSIIEIQLNGTQYFLFLSTSNFANGLISSPEIIFVKPINFAAYSLIGWVAISLGFPSWSIFPFWRIIILSENVSASLESCVTKSSARLSFLTTFCKIDLNSDLDILSRFEKGSSNISSGGSSISAFAKATFCFWPPDNSLDFLCCIAPKLQISISSLVLASWNSLVYLIKWCLIFSKTVKPGSSWKSWWTIATPIVPGTSFSDLLYTKDIPDPDLLIRSGKHHRVSNFLLWQIAYTEIYFSDTLWPDFNEESINQAIVDFNLRKRTYGKIN